jgi:uracil-DNA glycosylase
VPPGNKPEAAEVRACNGYLRDEIGRLPVGALILALGRIAHDATLRALGLVAARFAFDHGRFHDLSPGLRLLDSYHCSRYNTQTGRLTKAMFRDIMAAARADLDGGTARAQ